MSIPDTDAQNTAKTTSSDTIAGLSDKGWHRLSLLAGLIFALVLPFIIESYTVFQFTMAGIYAIAILGLNLLTGYNGQFSLAHNFFYAIGAYTCSMMMKHLGVSAYLTIPVAAIFCLIFGFLFGLIVTRLAGLYLALATFALAVATPQLLISKHFERWTGGVQGMVIVKPDVPYGLPLESDQYWYFFMLIFLVFMLWVTRNLVNSRSGRAMKAIRDNPIAARAMGVNSTLYKAITFGVGGLYAGIAGALAAIVVEFVAPEYYGWGLAFLFLTGMVVGGLASIPGVIFGALFILFLPNFAESFSVDLTYTINGVLLILIIYVMPSGAAGFFHTLLMRVGKALDLRSTASKG